jgi:hypothetical protein
MDEVLRIFVLGIEWFALWLERSPLHVAWPVLFVFPNLAVVLAAMIAISAVLLRWAKQQGWW